MAQQELTGDAMKKKHIAILTGGGDCPGINAVIRAVVKKAILEHDMTVIGIEDGFEGLILNKYKKLSYDDVSGILTLGGTILGTSNRANPYNYPVVKGGKQNYMIYQNRLYKILRNLDREWFKVVYICVISASL